MRPLNREVRGVGDRGEPKLRTLRRLGAVVREVAGVPDRVAHALVLRDLDAWLRLQFLGVACATGIVDHLGRDLDGIARATGVTDVELLDAFLSLGVALGEVRRRGDRFEAKGRRLRAVGGRSGDLRGLVEELVGYDSPVYVNLPSHLRGAPPGDYLAGCAEAIANASRLAEPVLAPVVREVVAGAESVLDVGCGSGAYLRHAVAAAPGATVVGIDIDAEVAAAVRVPGAEVRHADLFEFEAEGRFDVVLLLQNIYYWPPEQRPAVFARLRALGRTAVVASALRAGQAFNHHLDLALRVTRGNWRLPTVDELVDGLRRAGFDRVEAREPMPGTGVCVVVARSAEEAHDLGGLGFQGG